MSEFELAAYPAGLLGVELTVPVEVELPAPIVEACRSQFELARLRGKDPDFEDYLLDVVQLEATYRVDGAEIDTSSGVIGGEEEDE